MNGDTRHRTRTTKSSRILLWDRGGEPETTPRTRLAREGYRIQATTSGRECLPLASNGSFDLVLLDEPAGGTDSLEICRALRYQGTTIPILMLMEGGGAVRRILVLKMGADDCLSRPFDELELLARIETLLHRTRRLPSAPSKRFMFGDVKLDIRRAEVTRKGEQIPLSAKEFALIRYLLENRGEAIPRGELLRQVWGYDADVYSRTVDVHVAWLRQKVESDPRRPRWITTVYGIGYKFTD